MEGCHNVLAQLPLTLYSPRCVFWSSKLTSYADCQQRAHMCCVSAVGSGSLMFSTVIPYTKDFSVFLVLRLLLDCSNHFPVWKNNIHYVFRSFEWNRFNTKKILKLICFSNTFTQQGDHSVNLNLVA